MLLGNKDILAKLLAKENIFVRHSIHEQTASFDIKNRILTLPIFSNRMSPDVKDMMIGHEVGHALWTLLEEWEAALTETKVDKSILNIVEDARIEKRVKRTYPGITKSFVSGYRELFSAGFFGDTIPSEANILDRINLHFKMGPTFGIPFYDEQEEAAVELVDSVETFDDAIEATKILQMMYADLLESMEMDDTHGWVYDPSGTPVELESSEDEDDETGKDFDELKNDEEGSVPVSEPSEEEEDKEKNKGLPNPKEFNHNHHYVEPGTVETEETWEERKQELVNDDKANQPGYFNLPKSNLGDLIVDYKTVLKEFPLLCQNYYNDVGNETGERWGHVHASWAEIVANFQMFKNDSGKIINYMVKEFERKKAAKEYRRASTSKTGVLDVNKLHSYQYNEDVFLKKTLMPDGKNHGLVMLIDWSGSMTYSLDATIKQTLNLVWFCQKVNIPFEVYAFSSCYGAKEEKDFWDSLTELTDGEIRKGFKKQAFKLRVGDAQLGYLHKHMRLINFLSHRMTAREITEMARAMFSFARFNRETYGRNNPMYHTAGRYDLGSTPLVEALVGMQDIIPWFKRSNKLDVVNLITLTDGESNTGLNGTYNGKNARESKIGGFGMEPHFQDPITRKTYNLYKDFNKVGLYSRDGVKECALLYTLLKDRYGINNIGIYLDAQSNTTTIKRRTLERFLGWYSLNRDKFNKVRVEQKKDGFCTVKAMGFDAYYIIPLGQMLMNKHDPMTSAHEGMKKGQLRTAFKKSLKQKFGSRIFVDRMMQFIV